jgi:polar amino acid transport system substrate-binding protein
MIIRFIMLSALLLCGAKDICASPLAIVTGEWEPLVGRKLSKQGFFTALVQAAMEAGGLESTVNFYPWTRDQFLIESGQVFAAFPYLSTDERARYAYFSEPVYSASTLLYYKPSFNSNIHFEKLEDLKNYRVSGAKGFFYEELFKKAGIKVDYQDSESNLFKLLDLDRVDLIPMEYLSASDTLKKKYADAPEKIKEYASLPKPLNVDYLRLMVSKKYPDSENILKQFNAGLQKIKSNGQYEAILKEFGFSAS